MKHEVTSTNFIEMINVLPELPEVVKTDILKHHDRFEFIFNNCVSDPGVLKSFYQKFNMFKAAQGAESDPFSGQIESVNGVSSVAMSIEDVSAFVIYIYQMIYLPIREGMAQVEEEVQFNTAPVGRA